MAPIVQHIPLDQIDTTVANVRSDGETDLAGLTASLTSSGLAVLPTLIPTDSGRYTILMGERRIRAATAAGWETIPALVVDAPDPISAQRQRLAENLHRRDLNPIDEARALKIGWLCANAIAMGLEAAAQAILVAHPAPADTLAALEAHLLAHGWERAHPLVTQDIYLRDLGLGLTKAALKKKLQVLASSTEAQTLMSQLPMTAAAMRAVLRLEPAEQETLLTAIQADPSLATQARSIAQGVQTKGRSIDDAIAIAQGHVPGAAAADPVAAEMPPVATEEGMSEQGAADLVLPIYEAAQTIQSQMMAIQTAGGSAVIPEPWHAFLAEAIKTIQQAIKE